MASTRILTCGGMQSYRYIHVNLNLNASLHFMENMAFGLGGKGERAGSKVCG